MSLLTKIINRITQKYDNNIEAITIDNDKQIVIVFNGGVMNCMYELGFSRFILELRKRNKININQIDKFFGTNIGGILTILLYLYLLDESSCIINGFDDSINNYLHDVYNGFFNESQLVSDLFINMIKNKIEQVEKIKSYSNNNWLIDKLKQNDKINLFTYKKIYDGLIPKLIYQKIPNDKESFDNIYDLFQFCVASSSNSYLSNIKKDIYYDCKNLPKIEKYYNKSYIFVNSNQYKMNIFSKYIPYNIDSYYKAYITGYTDAITYFSNGKVDNDRISTSQMSKYTSSNINCFEYIIYKLDFFIKKIFFVKIPKYIILEKKVVGNIYDYL